MKEGRSFSKSDRLLKNSEFSKIQKIGKRLHSKNFLFVFACRENISGNRKANKTSRSTSGVNKLKPKSSGSRCRLGITITNKLEPLAVRRNRVKRIVREAFRDIKSRIAPGLNLIIIAKHGASDLRMQDVKEQLFSTLRQNNLLQ